MTNENVKTENLSNNPKMRKSSSGRRAFERQKIIFIVALMAIPMLHIAVFYFYQNFSAIILAFKDTRTNAWTLQNFKTFWTQLTNPLGNNIGLALKNTLLYFASNTLLVMPISLIMSFFLFKRVKGYAFFQRIFYLPGIISSLVLVTAYTQFLAPHGPYDSFLSLFGKSVPVQGYLANPDTATKTILIYTIWTGFTTNVLLYTGAMGRIPYEVLESAKIDGVGPWREMANICLPLIWPTFSINLLNALTGILSAGGPVLLFTQGKYETMTVGYWMFNEIYGDGVVGGTGAYNLISCAGLCFSAIVVPFSLFVRWLIEKVDIAEY